MWLVYNWINYSYLRIVSSVLSENLNRKTVLLTSYWKTHILTLLYTGWTGWICPILENYCGNFYLMSVLFFFVHLFSSPVTFYDISSDFWYWEIFFLSQIGDNPKGYPLEIFENDHSVFKKSFQISKCDAKTILKKSLKLT